MKTTMTFLFLFLSTLTFAQNKIYVHQITADNLEETWLTLIDHPDLNNNPNAQVIVKQHWKGADNDNPIGITYSTSENKWAIYTENQQAFPEPTQLAFNVLIGGNSNNFFTHKVDETTESSFTVLDHPELNNKDNSFVFLSTNVGLGVGIYNSYRYSTTYNTTEGRKKIFEASVSNNIPNNAAFHVYVGDASNSFTHRTTTENINGGITYIDHELLNDNPNATFIFEHDRATGDSFINKNLGIYYSTSRKKWSIYTQDNSTMPNNLTFTILIALNDNIYTAIPDSKFEQALIDLRHDDMIDGKVLTANIETLTSLGVSGKEITDLTGIEDFVSLTDLHCYSNKLTALDVSKNTALTKLYCFKNQLTALDISNNTFLEKLWAYDNELTTLDVSKNLALENLNIPSNQLKNIDISKNTALTKLYCYDNQLTTLDVSNNTVLETLWAYDNKLTTLDVSKNTALIELNINNNPSLKAINVQNENNINMNTFNFTENTILSCIQVDNVNNINTNWSQSFTGYSADCYVTRTTAIPDAKFEQVLIDLGHDSGSIDGKVLTTNISSLISLDVSDKEITDLTGIEDFVALKNLQCHTNQLTTLDLSKNTALDNLNCSKNKLTNLNLSNNTDLHTLWTFDNQFNTLDVSNNIALKYLNIPRNQLITIDVSNNIHLIDLYCGENLISSLDISNNTALKLLWAFDNKLTTLDVSKNIVLTDLRILNNPLLEAVNLRNGNNTIMNQFIFNNTPKLTCIQVDDVGNINTDWSQTFTGYSTDCFDTLSTEDLVLEKILQVYPNPVQETLYIKATNEITINEIQLYDVRGKMIRKEKEIKENISLKELNSGIYFVKILTNKGVGIQKIIKN